MGLSSKLSQNIGQYKQLLLQFLSKIYKIEEMYSIKKQKTIQSEIIQGQLKSTYKKHIQQDVLEEEARNLRQIKANQQCKNPNNKTNYRKCKIVVKLTEPQNKYFSNTNYKHNLKQPEKIKILNTLLPLSLKPTDCSFTAQPDFAEEFQQFLNFLASQRNRIQQHQMSLDCQASFAHYQQEVQQSQTPIGDNSYKFKFVDELSDKHKKKRQALKEKVTNYKDKIQKQRIAALQYQTSLYSLILHNKHLQTQVQQQQKLTTQTNRCIMDRNQEYYQDMFQYSIMKMQLSQTVFRFGITTLKDVDYHKHHFNKELYKFTQKPMEIQLIDLFVFARSQFYPLVAEVFNDFSSQSKIYKVLLNFNHQIFQKELIPFEMLNSQNVSFYTNIQQANQHSVTDTQQKSYMQMVRNRIGKYMKCKNFSSIEALLKAKVIKKKKKVILLMSQPNTKAVIQFLKGNLLSFSSELVTVLSINASEEIEDYQNTPFRCIKLMVDFRYQVRETSVQFQVLHQHPFKVTRRNMEELRRMTSRGQSVFCWLQIPRLMKVDQMGEIIQVYNLLKTMKTFSNAVRLNEKTKMQRT